MFVIFCHDPGCEANCNLLESQVLPGGKETHSIYCVFVVDLISSFRSFRMLVHHLTCKISFQHSPYLLFQKHVSIENILFLNQKTQNSHNSFQKLVFIVCYTLICFAWWFLFNRVANNSFEIPHPESDTLMVSHCD